MEKYPYLLKGWGTINHCQPALNPILHEASLEIVSDATCEAYSGSVETFNATLNTCVTENDFSYAGLISEDMLCAGAAGKDHCQGDSGGPMTVKEGDQDQHTLVGVVSWGAGCAGVGRD